MSYTLNGLNIHTSISGKGQKLIFQEIFFWLWSILEVSFFSITKELGILVLDKHEISTFFDTFLSKLAAG